MTYNVAIIGATGAVGRQMLECLCQRKFPFKNLYLLASAKSEGKIISCFKKKFEVQNLESFNPEDVDVAFFSAGSKISELYAKTFADAKCFVIDNTSFFRMNKEVPLIVPEINKEDLIKYDSKIISNPNCSTIQMLVTLSPIHKLSKILNIVVSTYQSVSGAGQNAISELEEQCYSYLKGQNIKKKILPKQIAFNVIPQIDVFVQNSYTKEEMKMVNETKKILDSEICVNATCVRVPTFVGHAESIYIELEEKISIFELEKALKNETSISYSAEGYNMPIDCEGKDFVYVSRLRKDLFKDNAYNMWVVSDNLLKGAALNSIQIAETLLKMKIL